MCCTAVIVVWYHLLVCNGDTGQSLSAYVGLCPNSSHRHLVSSVRHQFCQLMWVNTLYDVDSLYQHWQCLPVRCQAAYPRVKETGGQQSMQRAKYAADVGPLLTCTVPVQLASAALDFHRDRSQWLALFANNQWVPTFAYDCNGPDEDHRELHES